MLGRFAGQFESPQVHFLFPKCQTLVAPPKIFLKSPIESAIIFNRARNKGEDMGNTSMLNYRDEWEQKVGKKLRADFTEELDIFEGALHNLATCINQLWLGQPDLVKKLVVEDYETLDSKTLGFFGSWVLLGEALVRLQAARRLFLAGYLSRALASTRDALESTMTADICRNDGAQIKKWIKGKQIKLTKGYKYHPALNWKIWETAQEIMNPLGTHSYMEATFLSSVPQRAILFPNDAEYQRIYKHDGQFVLQRMLCRCLQMLLYIKNIYPEAKSQVKEFDDTIAKLTGLLERGLQIPLDELLVLKGKS